MQTARLLAQILDVSTPPSYVYLMQLTINSGSIQGWQGLVMVDGKAYNWMGDSRLPLVNQVSLEYTSTRSTFHFDVDGKVNLEVTFLSPVYPDDLGRQSQQFSYISIKALSADGASHNVQVYMDVSGGEISLDPFAYSFDNKD